MIAILTDFGNSEYVGVMKGVIRRFNKKSEIVDLYHEVAPQEILEGAWILLNSYSHFPKKTVFLCVVDPGVGSKRKCVAIRTRNYFFVGPDNGLMHPASSKDKVLETVELDSKGASRTFHGRDVFAKAAALIEKKKSLKGLGEKTNLEAKLEFHSKKDEGQIVRIDSFGNIITNITSKKKSCNVSLGKTRRKMKYRNTYSEAAKDEIFLIKGSSNTLEISKKNSSAANELKPKLGQIIKLG